MNKPGNDNQATTTTKFLLEKKIIINFPFVGFISLAVKNEHRTQTKILHKKQNVSQRKNKKQSAKADNINDRATVLKRCTVKFEFEDTHRRGENCSVLFWIFVQKC